MTELQLIVLAIVQGITEFLPISSSGHLILVPKLTGWPDQGLQLDVAVHVGTLGAVIIYLWRDLWQMLLALLRFTDASAEMVRGRRMILLLVVGTIPVVVAGVAMKTLVGDALRSVAVIGWTMLVFGILLYIVDRWWPEDKTLESLRIPGALVIGLWQVLALVPGTSRAGITMTGARMMGYTRTEAARFSLLLSIPTILAAGLLLTRDLIEAGDTAIGLEVLTAAGMALVSALIAMAAMMRWLKTASFTPFVVYRVALGLALLWIAYA